MQSFLAFLAEQAPVLARQTLTHLGLTFASLLPALALGIPLGIWSARSPAAARLWLSLASALQTVPSIALLGVLIPLLGIGAAPALTVLLLYALLPVIRNTYTGIREVSPAVLDAAQGMGMTRRQMLFQVELPLALPVLFAGIRTAAVINVGVATLAAYIGAGGLGEFIFGGIALNNPQMILAGAIPAALLALLLDAALAWMERWPLRRLRTAVLFLGMLAAATAFRQAFPPQGRLRIALQPEFVGRSDGLPGLRRVYGFDPPVVVLSAALMYDALAAGEADLVCGDGTDGRIRAYDLLLLEDDRHAFPPYEAAVLARQASLEQHPELREALGLLAGRITDTAMAALNYQTDYEKHPPEQVARAFLEREGLYHPPRSGKAGKVVVGSKIFTEQFILAHLLVQLIEGYTELDAEAKTGLGGTQVCFEALRRGDIDLYPEYSGTGLQVIVQPGPAVLDSLRGDPAAVLAYVDAQSQRRFGAEWLEPLGFNNTYAFMMRKPQAAALGIRTLSDLARYLESE